MILTPEQIKLRLKKLGVGPDKYLGQHFLINQAVLDDMMHEVKEHEPDRDKLIIEVGPGLGVLTRALTEENYSVVAIERDPVFAQRLVEVVPHSDRLSVIEGDVLTVLDQNKTFPYDIDFREKHYRCVTDYGTYLHLQVPQSGWHVVANIPYAITSPLLRKLVSLEKPPKHIFVLVQKEAAERVVAKAGDRNRGLLTVLLEIMAESRIVRHVPPTSFWPEPEVESSLLHLTIRPEPLVAPDLQKKFEHIVIAGFSQKRKQLANSLAGGLGIKPLQARELLTKVGIDPLRRAETLTIEEWLKLGKEYNGA